MTRSTAARINRKRAQKLDYDRDAFRDSTTSFFERLGDRLEGKGRTILYALAAAAALALLIGIWFWYSNRRAEEARGALGKAFQIAEAPVTTSTPLPGALQQQTFKSETERAQKALEEFQKVAQQYGSPYRDVARYMAATELLIVDRSKGVAELENLTKSGDREIAAQSKFALAQAREADNQLDAAAALYKELLNDNGNVIPLDTINLRLANVLEKQGKKDEAAQILFKLVETARKAQTPDGKPVPLSQTAREAADKLQSLDPARYAQLPPEPAANPMF